MLHYLKLTRPLNLLLFLVLLVCFRYGFLETQGLPLALNHWQYAIFGLAIILIAAGGYVINDIFDQEADAVNKPQKHIVGNGITENQAYNFYGAITITGVSLGFFVSNVIDKSSLAIIFVLVATLLYFYASSFKQIPLIGNIIISLLIGFTVLLIGLFLLYPLLNEYTYIQIRLLFSILIDYAIFAFIINLAREIVKDIEDITGDTVMQLYTLPKWFGVKKTAHLVSIMLLFFIAAILYYVQTYLMKQALYLAAGYLLLFVVGILLWIVFKLFSAKEKNDFSKISKALKWVLFFGVLSICVINYSIELKK